jgi:hypothetical protein
MKAAENKARTSSRKKASKKFKKQSTLSTCPVGGAGWCAYPFSIKSLEKRLKTKAAQKTKEPALVAARLR